MERGDDAEAFTQSTEAPNRRPRRVTAIVGVVAALAIVAAVLWLTFRGGDEEPATRSATASTTATTTSSPTTPATTTSETAGPTTPGVAPTGNADAAARTVTVDPGSAVVASDVPYLVDRALKTGAKTVEYRFEPPFTYVPLAGGKAVIVENNIGTSAGDKAQLADASGRILATVQAAPEHALAAVANDGGTRYALLDVPVSMTGNAGVLTLFDADGAKLATKTGVAENLRPAGFVGDRLFLGNYEVASSFVWDTASDSVSRYLDGLVAVSTSESSGRVAFTALADYEKPRCATVSDVRGAKPVTVSKSCGLFSATELSEDGRFLLGIRVPSDGSLQSPSRIIDVATGRPLVYFESEPLNIEARFMADGSVGLNAYVSTGGSPGNTIVRCTIEGDCNRMVETLPMPDYEQTLATRYTLVPQ